jgi:hypothetical protein
MSTLHRTTPRKAASYSAPLVRNFAAPSPTVVKKAVTRNADGGLASKQTRSTPFRLARTKERLPAAPKAPIPKSERTTHLEEPVPERIPTASRAQSRSLNHHRASQCPALRRPAPVEDPVENVEGPDVLRLRTARAEPTRPWLLAPPNQPILTQLFSDPRSASPKFPPNACRGERCGAWGRTAPIKPVSARPLQQRDYFSHSPLKFYAHNVIKRIC